MALISHEEYYDFAGLISPIDSVDRIDEAIEDAESYITNYLDRTFIVDPSPVEKIEIFSGKDQIFYWVKQTPLSSVTKVEYWDGIQWIDVVVTDGYTIAQDLTKGKVWFEERYTFFKGQDNWRITYEYGYDELPADLRRAICMLTKYFIQRADFQGLKSQSDGEQNFSYDNEIPKLIIEILNRYKRY